MLTTNVSPQMTPQFYDAVKETEEDTAEAVVKWIGFPKQVPYRCNLCTHPMLTHAIRYRGSN